MADEEYIKCVWRVCSGCAKGVGVRVWDNTRGERCTFPPQENHLRVAIEAGEIFPEEQHKHHH